MKDLRRIDVMIATWSCLVMPAVSKGQRRIGSSSVMRRVPWMQADVLADSPLPSCPQQRQPAMHLQVCGQEIHAFKLAALNFSVRQRKVWTMPM
mmetsp:Transcript_42634/g.99996  ORF Transcript_42634/g.99996 Transcript_42634/m.99996 type:complete len:94 (+) Transcript_42634:40-321(+)